MTTTQDFTLPGQSMPNPAPALVQTTEDESLVPPAVEMAALTSFMSDVCGDLFLQMVQDIREGEKVLTLTSFFVWATKYRLSHQENGGLVTRELDEAAPGMMLKAFNTIYGY